MTSPNAPPTPKWYHNVWFVLGMLFFVLGPLGLPLVWRHPRFSRQAKWGLTIATALYTLLLIEATLRAVQHALRLLGPLAPMP